MKIPQWLIWIVVAAAVFQMSLGGIRDLRERGTIIPSKKHAFADGVFLILLAIFMVLYNRL